LNHFGSAKVESNAPKVAKEMIDAIRKKSEKYPKVQKKKLSLLLDAARTPGHTFQQVLNIFRTRHLRECQGTGFAQVWVVGPQDSLVERIDQ
jgi:hypothetical protein